MTNCYWLGFWFFLWKHRNLSASRLDPGTSCARQACYTRPVHLLWRHINELRASILRVKKDVNMSHSVHVNGKFFYSNLTLCCRFWFPRGPLPWLCPWTAMARPSVENCWIRHGLKWRHSPRTLTRDRSLPIFYRLEPALLRPQNWIKH